MYGIINNITHMFVYMFINRYICIHSKQKSATKQAIQSIELAMYFSLQK